MEEQLFLERYLWFDAQVRQNKFPNASTLARQFECSAKTAQRSIDFFRCRLHAPARGRGLKLSSFAYDVAVFLSPPARGRGLKQTKQEKSEPIN